MTAIWNQENQPWLRRMVLGAFGSWRSLLALPLLWGGYWTKWWRVPMMGLTQLSNCLTLEGSFSSVSTATIARKGAFCSIFWALQDLHSFAPLRPEKFSKFSSQILHFFAIFQDKTSNFDNFRCKFRWNSTKFCRNFTDYTENAAKCRKSKETREKIRKKLDLS